MPMKRLVWGLCCGGVLAAGLVASSPALAALPAGSTFVQCFADGNSSSHATHCEWNGGIGVPASSSATAGLSPTPLAQVEAIAPPNSTLGGGASAIASYSFEVVGGSPGDLVPIDVSFSLGVFATFDSTALARIIIYTTEHPLGYATELNCNPEACDQAELAEVQTFQTQAGYRNTITLYTTAQAVATRVSTESARAFADPYITVSPGFANAGQYSIVVSPGTGNPPPVPEPGTAAMWALGAAFVAFRIRKRRPAC